MPVTFILSERDNEILKFLAKNKNVAYSVSEIREELSHHPHKSIGRGCFSLFEKGYVFRLNGPGHSYIYRYKTESDPTPPQVIYKVKTKKVYEKPGEEIKVTTPPLHPGDLDQLLKMWAVSQWNPKIFQTASVFPRVVTTLYKLALEVSTGSVVEKQHLDSAKQDLNMFLQDIEKLKATVEKVLNQKELWITSKFASFLLANNLSLEKYEELIRQAEDNN